MSRLRIVSGAEQVAAHMRGEIERGRWSVGMPGRSRLAMELGVSGKLIEAALGLLQREGLLVGGGPRRRRRIDTSRVRRAAGLRVMILHFDRADRHLDYIVDLQHSLAKAGHSVGFAPRSLTELKMEVPRIADLVEKSGADAFVVLGGARPVLEWFVAQPAPAFALFGRRRGLMIAGAGPNKPPAIAASTRRLIQLGHSRIVLLARQVRRLPEPGASEAAFLAELAAHGITPGPYSMPDWEETPDGFHKRLASLFRVTPPTALIIEEARFFFAALQFLAVRGLRVPQDVSLVCTDDDPYFEWSQPSVSHIRWEAEPVVRRIERWVENVSRGKQDLRQTLTPAKFVPGGTIGPARKDSR